MTLTPLSLGLWVIIDSLNATQKAKNSMNGIQVTDKVKEIWLGCKEQLRQKLGQRSFSMWIANIVPVSLDDAILVLGVSNNVFSGWLEENYSGIIEETLKAQCGEVIRVRFESGHEVEEQLQAEARIEAARRQPVLPSVSQPSQPSTASAPEANVNWRYSFESFVVGGNNRFAHGACQAVASSPGTAYNPLFIHSPSGLGKTHLLQAIALQVNRANRHAQVEYHSSEEFCNQYIDALGRKSLTAFRNRFRNVDVLLIDDVHFFSGKDGLQEEFFHTFNALYNARKQIVLTSDRSPHEIGGLEKRLISRFEWGLTADIQAPDLETRIAILRQKQQLQEIQLSDEVLRHLAERIRSNIRRLEGALLNLVSYASLTGSKGESITLEMANSLLANIFNEEFSTTINIENIQKIVAEYYDIRMADMSSKRRPANIAFPRQVAMYFSRKLTRLSLPAIAEQFNKNHATVIHAINSIEEKQATSEDFRREISILEKRLKI